jgi:fibronectin-binding autotransporter adhesin
VEDAGANLTLTDNLVATSAESLGKMGPGTLTFNSTVAGTTALPATNALAGTLVFNGVADSIYTVGGLRIAYSSGVAGVNAALTLTGNAQVNAASARFGVNGSTATVNMGGNSSLYSANETWFGVNGTQFGWSAGPGHATLNMTDNAELHTATAGTVNTHFASIDGSTAVVTMSGHSKIVCHGTNGSPVQGLFDISDGLTTASLTAGDFASVSVPAGLVILGGSLGAPGANGTVTLNDSATFTAGLPVVLGDSGSSGTIVLNGGVFTAPAFVTGDTSVAATIDFNGGALKAVAGTLSYYDINTPKTATGAGNFIEGANIAVNVMAGGAKIDSGGLGVTITQVLKHDPTEGAPAIDGGLTKLGDGSLTLSVLPTYTGNTTVDQGTLNLPTGISTPSATVYVATGAALNASSIVANTLTIGGPPLTASSAAAVPEPGAFALLAIALAAVAGGYCRKWGR